MSRDQKTVIRLLGNTCWPQFSVKLWTRGTAKESDDKQDGGGSDRLVFFHEDYQVPKTTPDAFALCALCIINVQLFHLGTAYPATKPWAVKLKNKRIFRVRKVNWRCKDHKWRELFIFNAKRDWKAYCDDWFLTFCLSTVYFWGSFRILKL